METTPLATQPIERPAWPHVGKTNHVGVMLRMAKFHGFEGPEGLLKMKRIVEIARNSEGIHNFLDGLVGYLEELKENPQKIKMYNKCTESEEFKRDDGKHSLSFMVGEGLKREREKKIPSSLPSDLVNFFYNAKITGLQSPTRSVIQALKPETRKLLEKTFNDAQLKKDDGIHRAIAVVAMRYHLPREAQIECFGTPLKRHA